MFGSDLRDLVGQPNVLSPMDLLWSMAGITYPPVEPVFANGACMIYLCRPLAVTPLRSQRVHSTDVPIMYS